ncbi:hypothetical protein RHGRI_037486 [Rhododendron griersonianum]|uniref:F-box domain-containing protein n=1 Tax=Rhododendron griersonianum TaxID=479676 RepID=A0AAV6HVK8_9ERIC|nr:hypothetical protein RHGRI_037486 [Rhododendron griersonianum]
MSSLLNSDLNHPPSPDFDLQSSDYDNYLAFSLRTQPSSKRRRTSGRVRKPAVDRITALPESLLLHLLSFLPIEDAIKTQVLSKRWQYLWTYSTSLVFRDSSDFDSSDKSFVEFVDKTIVLCTCSKLKKFGVRFPYEPDYASNVHLWIRFATGRGTEELQLDFDLSDLYEDDSYLLPQHLYTNSSLKALQFSMCNVMPKVVVCWNSLKKLTIGYAKLSEDVIQKILAGSPVLEILELYYFYGFNSLRVSNASVKKLILRDVWEHEEQEVEEEYQIDGYHSVIEISAPHLHLLEISGSLGDKIYRLGNVSSLVDAILNFHKRIDSDDSNDYERYSNMLGGLLQSLLHVKKMTLGTWAIEYFWDKFPGLRNFDEEHYWTSKYSLVLKPCSFAIPAHLLFFTEEYSVRTMNHEVDHPGQKLIGSSSGEAEEEEEKENKDRDDEEGKVEEKGMLPPPKRPRNQCLDRISALHDSLILHILSFLPMEDVVRTGTLSKRWEYLWTGASTLVFKRKEFDLNNIDRFATFVNRTLLLCTCSNIKKFVLQFMHHPDDECFPPDTNLWIRFTTQNNVEELYLRFGGFTEVHRLPQHLFTNSTLRILSASNCIIAPGGGISWRFLKSLTFEYAEFSDGALAKILLGCPVLEFLKIHMFSGARRMDINSASLKMLVVHFCMIENDEYAAVEISAPNLQVLELGDVWPRTFRIVNVSSLVRAELNFSGGEFSDDHENMHNQLLELLERLKHVKQLHLGDWSIQVLSVGELKGLPSPKSTCKVLTIKSHIMKWDFPGILSLLRGLPDLEKLVVDLTSCKYKELFIFCKKFLDSCNSDGEDPWTSHKSSFFQFMHLTTVEIVGFKELQEGFQLPLVQFLLQNAVVLEKMVIKIGKSDDVILLPYITFGVKRAFLWKQSS